jgi:hypothetical protein
VAYLEDASASENPLRESIAVKVGLKTFCGVGIDHHTLQSAVVFLFRRLNPPLKNLGKEDKNDDARKS